MPWYRQNNLSPACHYMILHVIALLLMDLLQTGACASSYSTRCCCEVQASSETIAASSAKVAELTAKLQQQKELTDAAQAQLSASQAETQSLVHQAIAQGETICTVTAQLEKAEASNQALTLQLQHQDTSVKALQAQLAGSRAEVGQQEGAMQGLMEQPAGRDAARLKTPARSAFSHIALLHVAWSYVLVDTNLPCILTFVFSILQFTRWEQICRADCHPSKWGCNCGISLHSCSIGNQADLCRHSGVSEL